MSAKQTEKETAPVTPIQSPDIPTLNVAMDKIVPDFEFNSRRLVEIDEKGKTRAQLRELGEKPTGNFVSTYHGVPAMISSLKSEGQLQPIKVRPLNGQHSGKYGIVTGFTRYLAAKQLGWPTIRAQVEPLEDAKAGVENMLENVVRDNLTPYEIARGAKHLRDKFEISGAELARRAGRSKSYFNNLMRILDRVHPDLVRHWAEGNVLADTDFMAKLAGLGGDKATEKERHALQHEEWEKVEGAAAGETREEGEEGEGTAEPPKPVIKRPSSLKIKAAMSAMKKADLPKATDAKELAIQCLRFALGTLKKIPGVYDPDADKDE